MRLSTRQRRAARRLGWSAAVVLAVLGASAPAASAHPPQIAHGTFTFVTDTLTPIRQADGKTYLHEDATIAYTGAITGVVTATDTIVVHSDGSVEGRGSEVCSSCTIGGRSGSFSAVFHFSGTGGQVSGRELFTGGSGGLAGLRGGGSFAAGPAGNSYAYAVRFARPCGRDEDD
jgi:hypothetical protein